MKAILTLVILVFSISSYASPFLKWDSDSNCQTYNIYGDSVLLAGDYETNVLNPSYDLVAMPVKGINYTVECCNYRGCSEASDPFVSLGDSLKPQNLRLVP